MKYIILTAVQLINNLRQKAVDRSAGVEGHWTTAVR